LPRGKISSTPYRIQQAAVITLVDQGYTVITVVFITDDGTPWIAFDVLLSRQLVVAYDHDVSVVQVFNCVDADSGCHLA
jgi:hypothetical protein